MPRLGWPGTLSRRDLIGIIVAVTLLVVLPVLIKEVDRRQAIRTRAQPAGEITINNGASTTNSRQVRVKLTSPYGSPAPRSDSSQLQMSLIPAAYAGVIPIEDQCSPNAYVRDCIGTTGCQYKVYQCDSSGTKATYLREETNCALAPSPCNNACSVGAYQLQNKNESVCTVEMRTCNDNENPRTWSGWQSKQWKDASGVCQGSSNSPCCKNTPPPPGGDTGGSTCEGQLSSACGAGGYPNNRLSATWNLSGSSGSCNVFVQDARGSHTIASGGVCSGSWDSTNPGSPITGNHITNDGRFELYVSNGTSGCTNQKKGDVTLSCGQAGSACDDTNNTLTFSCGAQAGTHQLIAKWLVRDEGGGCNVYIRAGRPGGGANDIPINDGGACNGQKTFNGSLPNGDVITNDGRYQLFVSNGSSCNNQMKTGVVLNCQPGGGPSTTCKAAVSKSSTGPWQTERGDYRPGEKAWVAVVDSTNQTLGSLSGYAREMSGPSGWRISQQDFSGKNNPAETAVLQGVGEYTFKVSCPSNQTATAKVIVTGSGQPQGTRGYKIANSLAELQSAQERSYTAHPVESDWTLSEGEGEKAVYAKFIASDGTESGESVYRITYTVAGPGVNQIACRRDIVQQGGTQDAGWLLTISGSTFGDTSQKGSVKVGNEATNIVSWDSSSLQVRYAKRQLPPGRSTVTVARADGKTATGTLDADICARLGKASLHIKSKLQRRPAADFGGDYRVQIREKDTRKDVHNRKEKFTKAGELETKIEGLDAGELHRVCLKGPQHLSRCKDYTPVVGDNTIEFDELTAGDIDGVQCEGDNVINSVDLGVVAKGWSVAQDVSSCADYNLDRRVNSLDYWVNAVNYTKRGDALE